MKMLKDVQYPKIVIWSFAVIFSFIQIMSTGWAATPPVPVDELQAQTVPGSVDALANSPATSKSAPAPQQTTGFVDSTAFQLKDQPLSQATKVMGVSDPVVVESPIADEIDAPAPAVIREDPVPVPIVIKEDPTRERAKSFADSTAFQHENNYPPAVQGYVDALKSRLGTGFNVTAVLDAHGGRYLVKIELVSTCPPGAECAQAAGTFSSLEFSLSKWGIVMNGSVRANYNGVKVGGKILLNVMGALEASFHPWGINPMSFPQTYIARLVKLASQITVKESTGNLLRFEHKGKSYTAYRDVKGNVRLIKK